MNTNHSKTKFSLYWSLNLSKSLLLMIAFAEGIKILLNPGTDPINVIMWRFGEIAIVVVPLIFSACFVYALINYENLVAKARKSKTNSERQE